MTGNCCVVLLYGIEDERGEGQLGFPKCNLGKL